MSKKKKNRKRHLIAVCTVALTLMAILAFWQGYRLFEQNFVSTDGEEHLVYVYPETTVSELMDSVRVNYHISSPLSLRLHAKLMKWPGERRFVRTGCYRIPRRVGDLQFIRMFRNGQQEPVKVTIRRIRTRAQLAQCFSRQLMMDSISVVQRLCSEDYMQRFGLDVPNAVCLFLPDTYEMYWDVSPDDLFLRMQHEHDRFWNDERRAKAAELGYTPEQIATIASIVEEETLKDVDMPIIAGLYMNRLRIGMPMQACPTVKFAWQDFSLRRILNKHLEIDSPYNTYKNRGLPPGPIRVASGKVIDYTLNPVKSNYLFMCASAAFDGTHHFSSNYGAHAAYAREYQRELNRRKIK